MRQKKTIPFEITSMDSLGQGVSKLSDKVTFIPKTTIGDRGEAEVMAERKGVAFARVKNISDLSLKRINPACMHFNDCPSCHYQHVNYDDELKFKQESFEKLFRKMPLPSLEVIPATKRLNYRNRIQLHYSLKSKLLGLKDPQTFEIVPIPKCLIAVDQVLQELKRLYQDDNWQKEAPTAPTEGHVEIYWHNDQLKVSWNKAYSEGGFTQVFQEMNLILKNILKDQWSSEEGPNLLDLFGGNGNLSDNLNYSKRLCVDLYQSLPGEDFISQDLYHERALKNVVREVQKRNLKMEHLLLDPPRSGLKNLTEWVEQFKPSKIAYVSCDPHTLVRDLQSVKGYSIKKSFLIDFFPSTFHFESLVFLERNHL